LSATRQLIPPASCRIPDVCRVTHWVAYCFCLVGQNADYMTTATRATIYARVSTSDQTCENQLLELRRYCEARGWQATEYVDAGISGAKDRRPALDQLMADAKRRKVDLVVCWKLDRFGRSLAHLVNAIQALTDAGVGFTSLGEGIDTRSATGRLMLGILGSFAEFERERIRERIHSGIARAKREGKRLGRRPHRVTDDDLTRTAHLSQHEAAKVIGVPRWKRMCRPLFAEPRNLVKHGLGVPRMREFLPTCECDNMPPGELEAEISINASIDD
jgi:putative DNA-invertase from lambdoid prophage Rac